MGRPRTLSKRPAAHLLDAAAKHATLAAGETPADETGTAGEAVSEESNQSRRAKTQRRKEGGKFA